METQYCSGALEGIKYEHPVSGVETPLVQSPDIACWIGWNAWSSLTSKKIDTEDRPNARQFLTLLFFTVVPASWSIHPPFYSQALASPKFALVTSLPAGHGWCLASVSCEITRASCHGLWALEWASGDYITTESGTGLAWRSVAEVKIEWCFMVCLRVTATALNLLANKSAQPHLECFGFSLRSTF